MDNARLPEPLSIPPSDLAAAVDTIGEWVTASDRDRLVEADIAIEETIRALRHLAEIVTNGLGQVVGRTGRINTAWGPRWLSRRQGSQITDWDTITAAARRAALFDPETGERRDAEAAVTEFSTLISQVAPLTPSSQPRVEGLRKLGLDKAAVVERERVGPWKADPVG